MGVSFTCACTFCLGPQALACGGGSDYSGCDCPCHLEDGCSCSRAKAGIGAVLRGAVKPEAEKNRQIAEHERWLAGESKKPFWHKVGDALLRAEEKQAEIKEKLAPVKRVAQRVADAARDVHDNLVVAQGENQTRSKVATVEGRIYAIIYDLQTGQEDIMTTPRRQRRDKRIALRDTAQAARDNLYWDWYDLKEHADVRGHDVGDTLDRINNNINALEKVIRELDNTIGQPGDAGIRDMY